jgi:hypothetical protein
MSMRSQAERTQRSETSRRAFLRGVGVTMALPWLKSLPVWGASSAAVSGEAGPFPKRFAVAFIGQRH